MNILTWTFILFSFWTMREWFLNVGPNIPGMFHGCYRAHWVYSLVLSLWLLSARHRKLVRKGLTSWCAIGVGTSRETLSLWATCSPYKWRGVCGTVYGYPATKIFLGSLWICRFCSYSTSFYFLLLSPMKNNALSLFFNQKQRTIFW